MCTDVKIFTFLRFLTKECFLFRMGTTESKSDVENHQNIREVKIALVGTYAVGKTSILNRYIRDNFSSEYIYTRGGNIYKKIIEVHGKKVRLDLIDTGGEEYQMDFIHTLYKIAHGIILVHDISKPDSFRDIDRWLEDIRNKCLGNPLIMLIGNKSDLDPLQVCTVDLKNRPHPQPRIPVPERNGHLTTGNYRVPYNDIEEKVQKENLLPFYCEVSAKTNMNIESIFELFVKEILHHSNKMMSAIWEEQEVDEHVEANAVTDHRIPKSKSSCIIL